MEISFPRRDSTENSSSIKDVKTLESKNCWEFDCNLQMFLFSRKYVSTPTAHASGLNELYDRTPIEVSRYLFNITHYTEIDMGHFAAFEAPKPVAASVFQFIKDLE